MKTGVPDLASAGAPGVAQNGTAGFPQQLSLFYAGKIAPNFGAFFQITYANDSGTMGIDNTDLRFADTMLLADNSPLTYGVTLNNNPTVQDLWNSTPAWGFPFAASALAPTPTAATLIDNGLAQQVIGLGAYASWNDLLYVEFDAYRGLSADAQGKLGITASGPPNTLHGFAPYWRVALEHSFGNHYLEIGTYGISAQIF